MRPKRRLFLAFASVTSSWPLPRAVQPTRYGMGSAAVFLSLFHCCFSVSVSLRINTKSKKALFVFVPVSLRLGKSLLFLVLFDTVIFNVFNMESEESAVVVSAF